MSNTTMFDDVERQFFHILEVETDDLPPSVVIQKYFEAPHGSITSMLLERKLVAIRYGVMTKDVAVAQRMLHDNGRRYAPVTESLSIVGSLKLEETMLMIKWLRGEKLGYIISQHLDPEPEVDGILESLEGDINCVAEYAAQCTNVSLLAALVTAHDNRGEKVASVMYERKWLKLTCNYQGQHC